MDNMTELSYTQEQLIQAMHNYGEHRGIQQNEDMDGWMAVERPSRPSSRPSRAWSPARLLADSSRN
jgi:hypothetical protein